MASYKDLTKELNERMVELQKLKTRQDDIRQRFSEINDSIDNISVDHTIQILFHYGMEARLDQIKKDMGVK